MEIETYKCCLITGASSGLGREIAYLLVPKTSFLILLGQNDAELHHTAKECLKYNPDPSLQILIFIGDLCDPPFMQTILNLFRTYPIDLVINNAGAGLYGKALAIPLIDHDHLFKLNGWAPLQLTYQALKCWQQENKKGTVVQIGSALAFIPSPYSATYGASKGFLVDWSLALSEELRGSPQKVLVFCPGMIKTLFRKRASLGKDLQLEGLETKEAATLLLKQIEKGQLLQVVPLKDKILLFLSHFFPLRLSLKLLARKLRIRT